MEYKQKGGAGAALTIPLPKVKTRAPSTVPVNPVLQRKKAIQSELWFHLTRPTKLQRAIVKPVLQASQLEQQEIQRLAVQRHTLQRQTAELSHLPTAAIQEALQRQQQQNVPLPVIRQPQTQGDWVTVMRQQAVQADGRRMGSQEAMQFTALQRQVAQRLAQGFRTDRQPAVQRYAEYAGHLVSLQRHPISGQVAGVVMSMIPQGERPALQRAVDDLQQRETAQRQQDEQALHLHSLQRQLAELDHEATQPVFERIQAKRGSGNPLPEAVRLHLEQGLNHDLSTVRIHDDAEADKLAKGINAIAFTTGTDIFFQSGKFNPNEQTGLELLAHEVTHTVQQSKGKVGKGVDPDSGLESEARAMGKKLSRFMPSPKSLIPPVAHKDGPYAPGIYSKQSALDRVQTGAASHMALKPLRDLQPKSMQQAAADVVSLQRLGLGDFNPVNLVKKGADAVGNAVDAAANKGKELIASGLTSLPGYHELCMAFGKDLVTGKAVGGNADAILTALTNWVPGPLKDIMRALRETKVIDKAWQWFQGQLGKLNLSGALGDVANAIKSADLGKARTAITSRINGVKALILGSADHIAEIAMTVLTAGLGPLGKKIMAGIRGAKGSLVQILKDPAKFARNLVEAVKGGFKQFSNNAPKHLQNGVGQWLTGNTGITFPAKFDLQGVFMTALSVMGLTYQAMRGKLIKALGPGGAEKVSKAENTVDALKTMKGGLDKAQEMKAEQGGTGKAIQEGIKSEVTKSLVVAGIQKVVSMLIPGGGFVNAIIGAFQTVQTVVQQAAQIGQVITSGLSSVAAIAAGNIGGAVGAIDRTLGGMIPIALTWLSKVAGLGNFGGKVKAIIQKVRGKLDSVVDKIVAKVKGLIEKLTGKSATGDPKARPTTDAYKTKDHDERVAKGLADIPRIEKTFAKNGKLENHETAKNVAMAVKGRHSIFKSVTPRFENSKVVYDWVASSGSQPGSTGLMVLKLDLNTIRKEFWPDRTTSSGKIVDGGRPEWSRPTRRSLYQQYPAAHQASTVPLVGAFKPPGLLKGQDRRHIYAFDQMVTNRVSALNGQPFDPAAQMLRGWGASAVKPTFASIWQGLRRVLTNEFNQVDNLFVGDSRENQQKGVAMEVAEQARDKAKAQGNQVEADRLLNTIAEQATDVPTGKVNGNKLTPAQSNSISLVRLTARRVGQFSPLEGQATSIKELTTRHPQYALYQTALAQMDILTGEIDKLAAFSKRGNIAANDEIRKAIEQGTRAKRLLSDYLR